MYERISGGSDVSVGAALEEDEEELSPPPPGSKEEVLATDEAMLNGYMRCAVKDEMEGSESKEGSGGCLAGSLAASARRLDYAGSGAAKTERGPRGGGYETFE